MIVKKVISIFILTALILSVTACKADTSSDETKSAVRDTMPEIEIKNPRELIREDLPVKDYGGYDFRIMLADEDIYSFDVIPTEQNGDRLNDATYMRDQLVSERFGVKITHYQAGSRDDLGNKAYASVMAGDDT
ncbi:MAG: hypothetical protein FWF15_11885, partial [Oscillospiraceae bacterium]|nr:hypothetical protein [Oscillospiraceae bacterium]